MTYTTANHQGANQDRYFDLDVDCCRVSLLSAFPYSLLLQTSAVALFDTIISGITWSGLGVKHGCHGKSKSSVQFKINEGISDDFLLNPSSITISVTSALPWIVKNSPAKSNKRAGCCKKKNRRGERDRHVSGFTCRIWAKRSKIK